LQVVFVMAQVGTALFERALVKLARGDFPMPDDSPEA
jgi:hypothetical protein